MKDKNIRRINLYAGPGGGKTTFALDLTIRLKKAGYHGEFVEETYKDRVFSHYTHSWNDQLLFFAEQWKKETIRLEEESCVTVTDCPILMSAFYAQYNDQSIAQNLFDMARTLEEKYPSINIFLLREDNHHTNFGRNHGLDESKEMDESIIHMLHRERMGFFKYKPSEVDKAFDLVKEKLQVQRRAK